MAFRKNIPINITGPSYQSRSRPLSSQQTVNFYHQIAEEGKDNYVLHTFHGLTQLSTVAGSERGMHVMNGVGYRVCGERLYSYDSAGAHTVIGTIPGTNRVIMANDGVNLIITGIDGQYKYDGTTLSAITDVNIVGSTAVTFINNQMVYTNGDLFVVSDAGIPDVASGLNAAGAESKPDALIRAYAFKQNIYMMGAFSVEPFWNSGSGNPPFQRLDGQIFDVGLKAIHSVANTDQYMYWLGDDSCVYRAIGGQFQRISTEAISREIEKDFNTDAIGYTFTFEGNNFYCLQLANKTFVVNEDLGQNGWFELSSDGGKFQGLSLIRVYNGNYVADNGSLYKLEADALTYGSSPILRSRTTSSINGKSLGQAGQRIQISRLELIMEQGVGSNTGQGIDPQIRLEVSFDGGRSFAHRGWARVGRLGETTLRVEFFLLDSAYDMIFRVSTSDPVPYEISSAVVDLRTAGR